MGVFPYSGADFPFPGKHSLAPTYDPDNVAQTVSDVRTFLITVSVVVTVGVAATYLFRYQTVNELLIETVRHEAESFAQLIVLTRRWNAAYGGVYVEKNRASNRIPISRNWASTPTSAPPTEGY